VEFIPYSIRGWHDEDFAPCPIFYFVTHVKVSSVSYITMLYHKFYLPSWEGLGEGVIISMSPEEKLKELGITLPASPAPLGSYVPIVRSGNLIFVSGILPMVKGNLLRRGKVGENISVDDAREDARQAAINALSILRSHIGGLNNVRRCVKITGYIASAPDFIEQPKVLNAASDLMHDIFGEAGRHARSAVGVNVLPLNSPLEIEFIFEV
jgi:enamine deaminase RidA (YjgF/YER057c/UK114 family)